MEATFGEATLTKRLTIVDFATSFQPAMERPIGQQVGVYAFSGVVLRVTCNGIVMSTPSVPQFLMIGSPMQLLVIGLIILILFGASRLGDVGKGLGEGIKNFKKGISGDDDEPKPQPPEQLRASDAEPARPADVKDSDRT